MTREQFINALLRANGAITPDEAAWYADNIPRCDWRDVLDWARDDVGGAYQEW